MPKRFFLIVLCSFVFFTLFFFLCSFVMIYRTGWGDPLAWVGPSVVTFFVLAGLGLRRANHFPAKALQAAAAVSGLPILFALFLGFGENLVKPAVIALGEGMQGMRDVMPDFFASFFSLVTAGTLFGLIPAFFIGLATALFYLPLDVRRRLDRVA